MYEQNDTSSQHTEADNRSSLCTANTMKVLSVSALLLWCQRHYQQISAKGGNCLKWAKISPQSPNLWFPFSSSSSPGLWRLFRMRTPSAAAPSPTFFYSPTLSSPLHPICANNTPLAAPPYSQQASVEFIQIFWHFASPHFPSRNDLWQLEMGSVGGASSNTPPSPPPPSFFVERPIFLFWLPSFFSSSSFIHRCSSCQLEKALKAPLVFSFFFFFPCDSTVWWTNWVIFFYLLTFCVCCLLFFVPFAQCPPTVWSCADTMYGSSEGNPPTAFMWILWGYGAAKWLLLLFLED